MEKTAGSNPDINKTKIKRPNGRLIFVAEMKGLLRHLASFALLTSILTSAFRLRFEPLTTGSNPEINKTKIKRPNGRLIFVAEMKGFEPLIRLPVYHISNVAH